MSVLINFKICDNVAECGGIEVCPTHALFWDEKNKKIGIDNLKCIGCGKCVDACPVSAIVVAKNQREYEKFKKEIESDTRKISDLFIDRYGAMPIDSSALVKENELDKKVLALDKPVLVEFFRSDAIQCLRNSIPIKELMPGQDVLYKKVEVNQDTMKKFKVKSVPALVFFKNGKAIGKIEGYFYSDEIEELKSRLNSLITKGKSFTKENSKGC